MLSLEPQLFSFCGELQHNVRAGSFILPSYPRATPTAPAPLGLSVTQTSQTVTYRLSFRFHRFLFGDKTRPKSVSLMCQSWRI